LIHHNLIGVDMSYTSLKSILTLSAMSALGLAVHTTAGAQEVGRVLSSTAIVSQVNVPRQVCAQEVVQVPGRSGGGSGAGAIMGGIAGGAMGNAVGQGAGRAAATVIGVLGGAILGDRIEGGGQQAATTQTVNRCTTQNVLENRTTGYQVVYEYAGKQYSVQMPNDPGPTIALQVAPVGAVQQAPTPAVSSGVIVQPAPAVVYTQQPTVVYAPPVVVAAPYYYPSPVIGASFIFQGGYGHGHGHGGHHLQQRPYRYY
jgi:uncharacterized protein YcfJ